MAMAGFDAAEADILRKVVSKKHREKKLRDFYTRFVKDASERGVQKEIIEEVWAMILGFEGYSFCKPHSASYTMVAYKSAFLRAHYPAEFMDRHNQGGLSRKLEPVLGLSKYGMGRCASFPFFDPKGHLSSNLKPRFPSSSRGGRHHDVKLPPTMYSGPRHEVPSSPLTHKCTIPYTLSHKKRVLITSPEQLLPGDPGHRLCFRTAGRGGIPASTC
jgi:hypothetical protein